MRYDRPLKFPNCWKPSVYTYHKMAAGVNEFNEDAGGAYVDLPT